MTTSEVHTPRGPVTRKDVARHAGVSTAVVSYVVNGGPKKVAPATEAKVRDAIRVLGYRPNATARALKMGSNRTLGLVIPDSSNPFWALLGHAVEGAAARRGYALLLTNSDNELDTEMRHIRNFAARQVDGVVLASVVFEPDLVELEGAEIRPVLLNHSAVAPGFNSVGVDLEAGARLAVEHLIGHGHTRIGLAMGITADNNADGREAGWRKALEAAGLPEGPLARDVFDRAGGYAAGQRLLAEPERPTAIFASSDMQAIGLLRAIREAGLSVPEDIAVASFDGSIEAEYSWPALTTVEQPVWEMAEAAVSALVGETRNEAPQHRIFPTQLRVRQSCGCP
ncbi:MULTISPECIES: LacI family DNA-binding transcriptional regulator [Arthrobacter]|uniref:LacI family transcriptional regulator n=1 Tax=Arthrobacter terricola TaxID=2547396 RepID=A0A4V2ZSP2_9MICC|nr:MULTISPECIES: LacI family DNA-binding transcriptional regulator [Arthrobacter]MBT8162176.1 LacI family transcriptional regulator [Arthrobacter sp. GN70]TDF93984.1 LacI family transcriptional regulator [Arthrobacter terricola]